MTNWIRSRTVVVLLSGLALARPLAAQAGSIDVLLDRAGARVVEFLDRVSDVTCKEEVLQEKLGPKGGSEARVESSFDYLVSLLAQGDEPSLLESRQLVHEARSKKNMPLLVSNGFATQLLIFHPYYQPSFHYERLADVVHDGKTYAQVRFQYVKGRPTPAALLLRGREYPLPLAGTALIDPSTGEVGHITTELATSMEDLGMRSFRSDVTYTRVEFPQGAKALWLPSQATVEVLTPRQHWRNVHRFTNYHLFSVSVSQDIAADKIEPKKP